MSLQPRLTPRQTQQLTMTPQLRQAIGLLQMSSAELQTFIEEELQSNPLIELDAQPGPEPSSEPLRDPAVEGASRTRSEPADTTPVINEFSRQTEFLADQTDLRSHLRQQISLLGCDPQDRMLAMILVDELDDDGYLRVPLFQIAERVAVPVAELQEALGHLQCCDPTGVGARNLAECFALQLTETDELTPEMKALLDHIDMIAGHSDQKVWSEIGVTPERYAELLQRVRQLNPAPGKQFEDGHTQYAVPDVNVFRNNLGGWSVELIASNLPAISINASYAEEVAAEGGAAASFVSDCSARANWLIRSIHQRSTTILNVAAEIVRVQENFFSLGLSHLRPLTMRDVATKLKIHESTVSRVTSEKYLMCERGTFELKFFFSHALGARGKGSVHSSLSVQEQIRKLVDKEDPKKTLSDDKIVKILGESGVVIARRTVTKYREAMNIPSSVQRRRFKSNLDKIRS